jgi:23S rRNA (pseudouridine1915-N3)-methyltransferase
MKIIAIGPKIDPHYQALIDDYAKRLRGAWQPVFVLLPYSVRHETAARDDESAQILAKLTDHDYVILLDERGRQATSEQFSEHLQNLLNQDRTITFVIGGAYGVNPTLRERANELLSLSNMVLPHQLARLFLTEQLYRAWAISVHHPYHHR